MHLFKNDVYIYIYTYGSYLCVFVYLHVYIYTHVNVCVFQWDFMGLECNVNAIVYWILYEIFDGIVYQISQDFSGFQLD